MSTALISKSVWKIARNPRKWHLLGVQLKRLLVNVVKYRKLSTDMNSRNYWNYRLSQYTGFWRDANYYYVLDLLPHDREFSLLDIGCAIGDGTELIQQRFPLAHVTGADYSDIGIAKAKARNSKVDYIVLDIVKDSLPRHYDYITMVETLEHFADPFAIVDKCLSACNVSLIISTPFSPDYEGPLPFIDEHRYAFTAQTFAAYECTVVRITDFIETTRDRCIIYSIRPRSP
jgi:2-polyprenyl-3-methyl-5-hydroxy-6-metoxy-1,4-benzoquinol methylase